MFRNRFTENCKFTSDKTNMKEEKEKIKAEYLAGDITYFHLKA